LSFADYINFAGCLTSLSGYSVEYVSTDESATATTTQRFSVTMDSTTKDIDFTIQDTNLVASLCTAAYDLTLPSNYYRETYKIKYYPTTPLDPLAVREILVPIKLVGNAAVNSCLPPYMS